MDKIPHIKSRDHRKVLTKAVLNTIKFMGLSKAALARILGISPASVSRMATGEFLLNADKKEWELASLLVRLYRGLDALTAGDEAALRSWLTHFNHDLNDRPDRLILNITGLVDCVSYVDAFRAKI